MMHGCFAVIEPAKKTVRAVCNEVSEGHRTRDNEGSWTSEKSHYQQQTANDFRSPAVYSNGLRGYSKGTGHPNSFIVPCVTNDPAAKMRKTLKRCGGNLLM